VNSRPIPPKCDTSTPTPAHQPHPLVSCHIHMGKTALYFPERGHVTDSSKTAKIRARTTPPDISTDMGNPQTPAGQNMSHRKE
jgi:hypothetical protein